VVHLLGFLKIATTLEKVQGEVDKFIGLRGRMASTELCVWFGNR
jgi:hypothetical protein